jgi:phage antirepressor YoqD-like protein
MHTALDAGNTKERTSVFANTSNLTRQVMSSREIAELTGSTHDNVLKTVRGLIKKGVVSSNETPYTHPQNGQRYTEFQLSYRDTMVVVSGYSVELRAKIIDRWQELEGRVVAHLQVPTNFAEALRLAAEQAEQNQKLQQVIDHQAPKVAAIKRLAAAGGAICITDAAKHLQLHPSKLFDWLERHRWIYRRKGSRRWIAFQPRITTGLMKHKVTDLKPDPETGLDRAAFDVLVTPKGLSRLAELQAEGSL